MIKKDIKLLNDRIQEYSNVKRTIYGTIFQDDAPDIAQIIARYTNGLENLIKFRDDYCIK